jgi:N-acetylglucosamine kinase-like BadF-type ATPase
MKIIADSGSTKTHWVIVSSNGEKKSLFSEGINPYFLDAHKIEEIVKACFKDVALQEVEEVHFYGAGCALPEKCAIVQKGLAKVFPKADIQTNSDLLAAAHALFGQGSGVACILGTGSNAAVYDGNNFVDKIQSLGYLLGDEGSGSYIGKLLLQQYFRKEMPADLRAYFEAKYNLDTPEVLDRLYKKSFPNRYLASFTTFVSDYSQNDYIQEIVRIAFRDFVKYQLSSLKIEDELKIGFVGSIAYYFQDILKQELAKEGYSLSQILKEPIHNLVDYHL